MEQNNYSNTSDDTKLDLILQKIGNVSTQLGQQKKRLDDFDKRLDNIDKRFDNIDNRISSFKAENLEEHTKIIQLLTSLNSAFLRYETEGLDKIKILFDADNDRKNHQDIYGHEFQRLNDLVAKNSFRISNLEQHL